MPLPVTRFQSWKQKALDLKREVHALALAYRDPRVPWYAKLLVGAVVAYALSPIDLIPDPIPVLGYVDDFILVPVGIYFCLKMIPEEVMEDCRTKADLAQGQKNKTRWIAAAVIVMLWLGLAWIGVRLIFRWFQ